MGLLDSTNKKKVVCELTGKVTRVNVNQDCLESSQPLPSDKKTQNNSELIKLKS